MYVYYKRAAAAPDARGSLPAEMSESSAALVREQGNLRPLPIADPADFPELSPAAARRVEEKKRCALERIEALRPLPDGERIERDRFSYLIEAYGDFPAGTPVLHRTTNRTEMYYVFDDLRVEGARLRDAEPVAFPAPPPAPDRGSGPVLGADPATAAALAISKKLLEWLGAKIIEEIFPQQPPEYFDQVYKTLTGIVRKELAAQTINEIRGGIDGTISWMKYDYAEAKAGGADADELIRLLRDRSADMHKLVRTLMLPDYRKPALSVFLLAVGIHLATLQEIAILSKPKEDGRGLDAMAAQGGSLTIEYATHAVKIYGEVLAARKAFVAVKPHQECFRQVRPPDVVCTDYWHWEDSFNGTGGRLYPADKHGKGKDDATRDMRARLVQVEKELSGALRDPNAFAEIWKKVG